MVAPDALQEQVGELATEFAVPGVAVGVVLGGEEQYAYHGVTSLPNPLPVDDNTLFQFGSTGKTLTATAMMRLVEQGKVDLDAPVRRYVPELRLRDEQVAREVTVLHLFNHTAGWEGDLLESTGDGDDALERYVALMANLEQVSPLGATVSYNNASLSLAGRVIEKVTGSTYEQAIRDLLLNPLGLANTLSSMSEIMVRRFAIGHHQAEDGQITPATGWALPRAAAPAGGWSATARDQIAWARFHLGGGVAADGTRLLSAESIARMQQPTASMPGSALGDHVGISWLLRDVDGVRLVAHGGTTIGQHSEFIMVPERDFAVISLTNSGPNGPQFNEDFIKWALREYLGVVEAEPVPVRLSDEALAAYTGRYETIMSWCEIAPQDGRLLVTVGTRPEQADTARELGEDPDETQQFVLAVVEGDGNRYVVAEGPAKGMKGYFSQDAAGRVDGVHLGGRLATRVGVPA